MKFLRNQQLSIDDARLCQICRKLLSKKMSKLCFGLQPHRQNTAFQYATASFSLEFADSMDAHLIHVHHSWWNKSYKYYFNCLEKKAPIQWDFVGGGGKERKENRRQQAPVSSLGPTWKDLNPAFLFISFWLQITSPHSSFLVLYHVIFVFTRVPGVPKKLEWEHFQSTFCRRKYFDLLLFLITIQGPFDGVSVRGQLFCPKHSHLPFPLPKVVKNLTVPEWDTNANSFANYVSPPEGLRLFSAKPQNKFKLLTTLPCLSHQPQHSSPAVQHVRIPFFPNRWGAFFPVVPL